MIRRAPLFLLLGPAVYALRRVTVDQYWRWHNRAWTDGWSSAWECAEQHMVAYEADPEKYVAERGTWWRDLEGTSSH